MTKLPQALALLPILWWVGGCNMVYSETAMFAESDRAELAPKDGIWLAEDNECRFESGKPETTWPECAVWVVSRQSGRDLQLNDGKGQAQRIGALIASVTPLIVQLQWLDDAKQPATMHYGFFGLEPSPGAPEQHFSAASTWVVECGIQEKGESQIQPFPGISVECRPSSKDAIRAAAVASRRADQMTHWRWLRPENR